jgi:hypothetical protein
MGYACPVCETPQSDGEHLANHLAFTAMLGDGDHATWLDDHAPGWEDEGPDELAPRVTEYVEEADYPQVFEDTRPPEKTGHGHDDHGGGHQHGHGHQQGNDAGGQFEEELRRAGGYGRDAGASRDPEAQRIVAEARRMTEEMLDEEEANENEASEGDGGDGSASEERSDAESSDDS